MERRSITLIVVAAVAGIIFLVWSNSKKKSAPAEAPAGAPVPAAAATMGERPIDVTAGTAFESEFTAIVSTWGGALKSVVLHNTQYHQAEREGPALLPKERRAAGPFDVVSTWSPSKYPFQLGVTELGWKDKPEKAITRVVRAETAFEQVKGDANAIRLAGKPTEGDLPIQGGDQVVAGGGKPIAITETPAADTLHLESPLPAGTTSVKVVRTGKPLDQYRLAPNYTLVQTDEAGVTTLVWPNPTRDQSDVYIERSWKVVGDYQLEHRTRVLNLAEASVGNLAYHYAVEANGWVDPHAAKPGMFSAPIRNWSPACYVSDSFEHGDPSSLLEKPEKYRYSGKVGWFGINQQYFLLAGILKQDGGQEGSCDLTAQPNGVIRATFEPQSQSQLLPPARCRPAWQAGSALPPCVELENKGSEYGVLAFDVFAGPKDLTLLTNINRGLDKSLDFWFVGFLAKPMLSFLKTLHGWVASWWLAIVLLTILVKGLTLPLTQKSFVSMQRMQQLKPEMDKIREKHPEDKQKQQQAMMDLYKRHKVNPLGGCLPMLVQMPIYIALYRTIYSAVDLFQAPLFGWIGDMTQPDPYYILPVLLGAFMIVQQAMTPTPGGDPMQQKIMKYFMPGLFSLFMLLLPSGLVFYIFVSTLITIGQQWWIKRRFAPAGAGRSKQK